MIEVKDLCKFYGEVKALNGVSFSVQPREIIGLLGPNGAGKTTLMKILSGYLHPSAGTARIAGLDVLEHTGKIQKMIGYLPENAPFYPELTVQANLRMIAELRNIPESERDQRLSEAIRAVGLEDRLTKLIGTLSKGYRQRVGLAQAILHRPQLLILDEPTNGLDPTQIVEVRRLIRKLANHSTILLSTHILSEVEATCDRVIIVMNGEVKADARLDALSASSDAFVSLATTEGEEEIFKALRALPGVNRVALVGREDGFIRCRVRSSRDRDVCPDIYRLARDRDWTLNELGRESKTLESVFNELAAA